MHHLVRLYDQREASEPHFSAMSSSLLISQFRQVTASTSCWTCLRNINARLDILSAQWSAVKVGLRKFFVCCVLMIFKVYDMKTVVWDIDYGCFDWYIYFVVCEVAYEYKRKTGIKRYNQIIDCAKRLMIPQDKPLQLTLTVDHISTVAETLCI